MQLPYQPVDLPDLQQVIDRSFLKVSLNTLVVNTIASIGKYSKLLAVRF